MKPNSSRLVQLDGLRGLAALSVFFSHCVGMIPGSDKFVLQRTPLHLFWDGTAAVNLFFVLSGFVLTLPFVTEKQRNVEPVGFIIKRLTRLYPAYWAALLIALGLRFVVLQHDHLGVFSTWANSLWALPITRDTLLRHFFMIAPHINTHGIDPVIWTLVIEMKVSLLFPAIIFMVQRTPRYIYAVAIVAALIAISPHLRSLVVLPVFVIGSYLAKYLVPIRAWFSKLPRPTKALLLLIGLLLYSAEPVIGPQGNKTFFVVGFGAGLLIILFLTSTMLSSFASSGPVHFLGKVSYSFYLTHLPVLLAVCSVLYPIVHSSIVCMGVALAASLILSKILYEVVERPPENYGKQLASRINYHHASR